MSGGWVVGERFTLLDRIGAGGSGRVWRAYDQHKQQYCAAKLVHRDVKPANLLLEPSPVGAPHIRLADFGIALADDDARDELSCCTPTLQLPARTRDGEPLQIFDHLGPPPKRANNPT